MNINLGKEGELSATRGGNSLSSIKKIQTMGKNTPSYIHTPITNSIWTMVAQSRMSKNPRIWKYDVKIWNCILGFILIKLKYTRVNIYSMRITYYKFKPWIKLIQEIKEDLPRGENDISWHKEGMRGSNLLVCYFTSLLEAIWCTNLKIDQSVGVIWVRVLVEEEQNERRGRERGIHHFRSERKLKFWFE